MYFNVKFAYTFLLKSHFEFIWNEKHFVVEALDLHHSFDWHTKNPYNWNLDNHFERFDGSRYTYPNGGTRLKKGIFFSICHIGFNYTWKFFILQILRCFSDSHAPSKWLGLKQNRLFVCVIFSYYNNWLSTWILDIFFVVPDGCNSYIAPHESIMCLNFRNLSGSLSYLAKTSKKR